MDSHFLNPNPSVLLPLLSSQSTSIPYIKLADFGIAIRNEQGEFRCIAGTSPYVESNEMDATTGRFWAEVEIFPSDKDTNAIVELCERIVAAKQQDIENILLEEVIMLSDSRS